VAFLKSFFAGIVVLAVAMLAKSMLVRALQMNAANAGSTPPGTRGPAPLANPRVAPRTPAQVRHDEPEDMLDAVINVRRIEGKINAASTKRLAELLQRHPDLAAQAVRRWLAQGNDSR